MTSHKSVCNLIFFFSEMENCIANVTRSIWLGILVICMERRSWKRMFKSMPWDSGQKCKRKKNGENSLYFGSPDWSQGVDFSFSPITHLDTNDLKSRGNALPYHHSKCVTFKNSLSLFPGHYSAFWLGRKRLRTPEHQSAL